MPSTPIRSPRSSRHEAIHHLGAQNVGARLELDPAGAVLEVEEGHLALAAAGDEAAGDRWETSVSSPGAQAGVRGPHRRDRLNAVELVRERLDARSAQGLQLAPAVGEDVGGGAVRLLTHGRSPHDC